MTWLYIPQVPTSSTSALDLGCWESQLSAPSMEEPVFWLTLSGKATRRPLSWRGWKTRPWIRRLSGMMFTPLQVAISLHLWKDSVRSSCALDTPASRSPSPAAELERMILGIYGPRSLDSLRRLNPNASFSKMSQVTFDWVSTMCGEIWKAKATALRLDYLERLRLGQVTGESGSSSLLWPRSPQAADGDGGGTMEVREGANARLKLGDYVAHWPSPTSADSTRTTKSYPGNHNLTLPGAAEDFWPTPKTPTGGPESRKAKAKRGSGGGDLGASAVTWPTPRTVDSSQFGHHQGITDSLTKATRNWPTLRAEDSESCGNHPRATDSLTGATKHWPTPTKADSASHGSQQPATKTHHTGTTLQEALKEWPTPAARDFRTANSQEHQMKGVGHMKQLPNFVDRYSHRELTTPDGRRSSSGSPPLRRALNPTFVEWLMGWPPRFGKIDYALPGTEWSLWLRRMRSSLLRLCFLTIEE
jgi:hypothetical protein